MTQPKYISKYSNNKEVSAAQYITEMICEKKAKVFKLDLHYRFWTNKEWSAYYRNQIASANKLLKTYSSKAIVNALKSPQASKIYSLRAPTLTSIIKHEEAKLEQENTTLKQEYDRKDNAKFAKNRNKKNIISKIKDLDDGT
jgi:hypothetical protein